MVAPAAFVEELAAARIGRTFNQYAEGARAPLLRERLAEYLGERADAPVLLVGEAPGYRGARSGIPFTSERQVTGHGPAEATASVVSRVLSELGLGDCVVLWNVVPTHPGTAQTNRRPTQVEIAAGLPFVRSSLGTAASSASVALRMPHSAGRTSATPRTVAPGRSGPGWLNCSIAASSSGSA